MERESFESVGVLRRMGIITFRASLLRLGAALNVSISSHRNPLSIYVQSISLRQPITRARGDLSIRRKSGGGTSAR